MTAVQVFKALSSETRILIVNALIKKDYSVSDLVSLTKKSQPDISLTLNKLELQGIVSSRKNGKFRFYSINNKKKFQKLLRIADE